MAKELDKKDREILEILKADGRRGFVSIGKAVGLTEGAVRARVKRMVRDGTIDGFSAIVNSTFKALVLAKLAPKLAQGAIGTIRAFSKEIFETSGNYDLAVFVEADSLEGINRAVDKIRAVRGVVSTDTLLKLA